MLRLNAFARKCVDLSRRKSRRRQSTLSCFLSDTKDRLNLNNNKDRFVFVMGNQASDADSVVSSLVIAYVKSLNDSKRTYVPLVSVTRDIFVNTHPLEPFLLRPAVSIDDLIFLEDVYGLMKTLSEESRMEIILTDHNKLVPGLHEIFGDHVVEIYDHHEDQRCYDVRVRNVAFDEKSSSGLGSCCTIVGSLPSVEKILKDVENEIARMLLDVILVDTVGLRKEAGKTKPLDVAVAKKLGDIVNVKDISKRFQELSDAKFDPTFWKARSTSQLLKYDFKKYRVGNIVYGASSIPITIRDLVVKEGNRKFEENIVQWMRQNSLRFLLLVSMTMSGDIANRELGICSTDKDFSKNLTGYLQKTDLELKKQQSIGLSESTIYFEAFSQGNKKCSRKRITPLVDAYLN